jgi:hypothetical protein
VSCETHFPVLVVSMGGFQHARLAEETQL